MRFTGSTPCCSNRATSTRATGQSAAQLERFFEHIDHPAALTSGPNLAMAFKLIEPGTPDEVEPVENTRLRF